MACHGQRKTHHLNLKISTRVTGINSYWYHVITAVWSSRQTTVHHPSLSSSKHAHKTLLQSCLASPFVCVSMDFKQIQKYLKNIRHTRHEKRLSKTIPPRQHNICQRLVTIAMYYLPLNPRETKSLKQHGILLSPPGNTSMVKECHPHLV